MVAFVRGRTITTAEPSVTVDAGLALGVHRFQLVVVTADGRRSVADVVDLSVQRLTIPLPLDPVVRPTVIDPVVNPSIATTVSPTLTTTVSPAPSTTTTVLSPTLTTTTTRIRKPLAAAVPEMPEPASPATSPPQKRKARSKRRSES